MELLLSRGADPNLATKVIFSSLVHISFTIYIYFWFLRILLIKKKTECIWHTNTYFLSFISCNPNNQNQVCNRTSSIISLPTEWRHDPASRKWKRGRSRASTFITLPSRSRCWERCKKNPFLISKSNSCHGIQISLKWLWFLCDVRRNNNIKSQLFVTFSRKTGKTALRHAVNEECLQVLAQYGDINSKDKVIYLSWPVKINLNWDILKCTINYRLSLLTMVSILFWKKYANFFFFFLIIITFIR